MNHIKTILSNMPDGEDGDCTTGTPMPPTTGKEWEDMPPNERPLFWTTPSADGVCFRVAQLIFKTNDDALDYVKRTTPERVSEALNAWR